jgi:hypothetical protein
MGLPRICGLSACEAPPANAITVNRNGAGCQELRGYLPWTRKKFNAEMHKFTQVKKSLEIIEKRIFLVNYGKPRVTFLK